MPAWLQRFSLCAITILLGVSFSAGADLASGKRAYQQKDAGLFLVKQDATLKSLWGDPRYKAFLRKMNLPE